MRFILLYFKIIFALNIILAAFTLTLFFAHHCLTLEILVVGVKSTAKFFIISSFPLPTKTKLLGHGVRIFSQ